MDCRWLSSDAIEGADVMLYGVSLACESHTAMVFFQYICVNDVHGCFLIVSCGLLALAYRQGVIELQNGGKLCSSTRAGHGTSHDEPRICSEGLAGSDPRNEDVVVSSQAICGCL